MTARSRTTTSSPVVGAGPHVAVANLLAGDLVFYADNPVDPATIHHVGLYIGNGLMVHTPHTGEVASIWRGGACRGDPDRAWGGRPWAGGAAADRPAADQPDPAGAAADDDRAADQHHPGVAGSADHRPANH